MASYPLSPVMSDCDSLASDELDALLDAQGDLSHWPTPPISGDDVTEVNDLQYCSDEKIDYHHLTSIFVEETRADLAEVETMRTTLFRAQLPPELLALAFNTIVELNRTASSLVMSPSKGLLLTATLYLAALYTIDHPPKLSEWSKAICDGRWTAAEIDQMGLRILSALDWRLHRFGSPDAIQRAMQRFRLPTRTNRRQGGASVEANRNANAPILEREPSWKSQTDLRVHCEDGGVFWVNGQLTPEGTPTETSIDCVWNSSRAPL